MTVGRGHGNTPRGQYARIHHLRHCGKQKLPWNLVSAFVPPSGIGVRLLRIHDLFSAWLHTIGSWKDGLVACNRNMGGA